MRRRRVGNRRTAFIRALSEQSLACVQRMQVSCQWRCLTCGFSGPASGVPQQRFLCVNEEGMGEKWFSWSKSRMGWYTIDCLTIEVDRAGENGSITVNTLAEVRGGDL